MHPVKNITRSVLCFTVNYMWKVAGYMRCELLPTATSIYHDRNVVFQQNNSPPHSLSLVKNLLRKSASKLCSGRANSKIRIQLKTQTGKEFSGNDCFVLSPKNRVTLYLLCFFRSLLGLNNWIWPKVVVLHINILFITYLSFMTSYNIDYYKKKIKQVSLLKYCHLIYIILYMKIIICLFCS